MNSLGQKIDFRIFSPELVLLGVALMLLILGLFREGVAFYRVTFLSKLTLAVVFIMICLSPPSHEIAFQGLFASDAFTVLMKALVVGSALLVLMLSQKSLPTEDIIQYEYLVIVLLATLGMLVMISANNLMSLFMGLELQSLNLYTMVALRRDNHKASEAAMKYFLLGALSTALLLYGCSLVYGYGGTTNFDALNSLVMSSDSIPLPLMVGTFFLMGGLLFKISAVPFHMWTPDIYEGAPSSVTAFLASAPKIAGFALITRVLIVPLVGVLPHLHLFLASVAILSMCLGAFAALNQQAIKRLLAYSAIGNMGYALIGIIIGTEEGVAASLVYLIIYLITIIGVFGCLLTITRRSQEINLIDDLKGLSRVYPGTACILAFLLFSLAGIPPLAGFLGKFFIFQAAISAEFYTLAIIGILTTIITAAYYLRLIKVILIDQPDLTHWLEHYCTYRREPALTGILLGITGALIWIFLAPASLLRITGNAAAALFDY